MTKKALLITTYTRPYNVQTILQNGLKAKNIDYFIIGCHNPNISFDQYNNFNDSRILIKKSVRPLRAGHRWILAHELNLDYVIAIDDDIALNSNQIEKLMTNIISFPNRPHGVIGSVYSSPFYNKETNKALNTYHIQENKEVQVLHQIYAVTREHVKKYLWFEKKLNSFNFNDPHLVGGDIVISFSGYEPPLIHNLGPLQDLPGAWDPNIAIHMEKNFNKKRGEILSEILSLQKENKYGI